MTQYICMHMPGTKSGHRVRQYLYTPGTKGGQRIKKYTCIHQGQRVGRGSDIIHVYVGDKGWAEGETIYTHQGKRVGRGKQNIHVYAKVKGWAGGQTLSHYTCICRGQRVGRG